MDLIGQENADQFYQRYISNYVTEEDMQKIASWGVDSIQLPLNYWLLTLEDQPGLYLEGGFKIIDIEISAHQGRSLFLSY